MAASFAALLLLAGLPAVAPLAELARFPAGFSVWGEADRLLELVRTSVALCGLTALLAVPAGALLGFLLSRTDLPARGLWLTLLLLAFFIPVPVVAAGWQTAWAVLDLPKAPTPLGRLLAAAGLHALVALPWAALVAGLGFRFVEPELEEEALLLAPPWRVFRRVTLPRAGAGLALAAGWVFLLTWQEITISDLLQVRTFAEEVYQQFSGGRDELARALAAALPALVGVALLAGWGLRRWRRLTPAADKLLRDPYRFPLGAFRRPALGFMLLIIMLLLGVPLTGLLFKAGLKYASAEQPGPPTWELGLLLGRVGQQLHGNAWLLLQSTLQALAVGLLASFGALWLLFVTRRRPVAEAMLFGFAALLLALPAPVLGVGLLTHIQALIGLPGLRWLGLFLYDRPSPVPTIWADLLRFGPVALLMLWPLVRLVPLAHEEEAWLCGAGPWRRFRLVYLGPLRGAALAVALAVAALALGEIGASKLTATPGDQFLPLAHHLFQLMHASADAELAALSLCMLAIVAAGAGAARWLARHAHASH